MKIYKKYFYFCKAIKEHDEWLANELYQDVKLFLGKPKRKYWLSKFMKKNNCYIENRFFK